MDENTAPSDEPGGEDAAGGGDALSPEALSAELKKVRAEAAKYRTQLRDLKPMAEKAKALEEAGKSEIEKATEKLSAAEKRALEAETRALRLEVAIDKGLTPVQAKRLIGSTLEELSADADALLESFGGKKPPVPGKPQERLQSGQGGDPDDGLDSFDPDKLAALVPRSVF